MCFPYTIFNSPAFMIGLLVFDGLHSGLHNEAFGATSTYNIRYQLIHSLTRSAFVLVFEWNTENAWNIPCIHWQTVTVAVLCILMAWSTLRLRTLHRKRPIVRPSGRPPANWCRHSNNYHHTWFRTWGNNQSAFNVLFFVNLLFCLRRFWCEQKHTNFAQIKQVMYKPNIAFALSRR